MIAREIIKEQLAHTLSETNLHSLGEKVEGKVRDSYLQGKRRVLVTTDRLSAFDRVLTTIPFKGQVLTQMALYWFEATKHIVENHIIETPHPNVMIAKEVDIIPVELVVRGYLAGSGWRDYQKCGTISGIKLPLGLKKSEKLVEPIITPSTKAERGKHDEPISSAEVVDSGLVSKKIWDKACEIALNLFNFGTKRAQERGLILVDTKYELGIKKDGSGEIILADEIHTPDSSRYWIMESYPSRFFSGEEPEMLDKEFVRSWLISQGYMGEGIAPNFSDDFRIDTAIKYIDAYERITGRDFNANSSNIEVELERCLKPYAL